MLQSLEVGNLLQKLLFCRQLVRFGWLSVIHLFSHLFKMLLHHLIWGGFLIIVNLSAESNDLLEWVRALVKVLIPDVAHALESSAGVLRIWIGHVEGLGVWLDFATSSGSCREARRRRHREVSLANWVHLEAAAWELAVSGVRLSVFINLFQHCTLAGVGLPAQLSVPACQSADLESEPHSLPNFQLMN